MIFIWMQGLFYIRQLILPRVTKESPFQLYHWRTVTKPIYIYWEMIYFLPDMTRFISYLAVGMLAQPPSPCRKAAECRQQVATLFNIVRYAAITRMEIHGCLKKMRVKHSELSAPMKRPCELVIWSQEPECHPCSKSGEQKEIGPA